MVLEDDSMTIIMGNMAAGRQHSARAEAESLHLISRHERERAILGYYDQ